MTVRTSRPHPLLRFAHFGCGDHFHRLRDFFGVLDALNLAAYLFTCSHGYAPGVRSERFLEVFDGRCEHGFVFLRELFAVFDTLEQFAIAGLQKLVQIVLKT